MLIRLLLLLFLFYVDGHSYVSLLSIVRVQQGTPVCRRCRWCCRTQGSTKDIGDKSGQMGNNLKAVSLGSTKVVAIAAGCDFTCAVKKDGAVVCW